MIFGVWLSACTLEVQTPSGNGGTVPPVNPPQGNVPAGDTARVVYVIDGDTIDVDLNGQTVRVRYIGINTPETDEACYSEARNANIAFVRDKTVTLVRDVSDTDRFDRLLRYVYVDGIMVNAQLVSEGWAENAEYPPDTARAAEFRELERVAAQNNRGCHPTGIFNDGNPAR